MKSFIVINKDIYLKYKEDILPLNPRIFDKPYFYELSNYETPMDLKGISSYLTFIEEVVIYSCSTFIDFINILLVLSFLKNNNYQGKVTIKYVFANNTSLEKSILVNSELKVKDYDRVDEILNCIKNNNVIKIVDFKVVGYLNFINFYNNMVDIERFMISLEEVIEDFEEDVNEIALYLETKYSNMELNKQYYLNYLNKYM